MGDETGDAADGEGGGGEGTRAGIALLLFRAR
jgi:hypothetical protein